LYCIIFECPTRHVLCTQFSSFLFRGFERKRFWVKLLRAINRSIAIGNLSQCY
jgi:hypothetical protein